MQVRDGCAEGIFLCWAFAGPRATRRESSGASVRSLPPPRPHPVSLSSPLLCLSLPALPVSLCRSPLPVSLCLSPLPLSLSLSLPVPLSLVFLLSLSFSCPPPSPSLWLAGSLSSPIGSVGGGRSLTQAPPQLRGCGGCGGAGPGRRQEDGQGPRVSPAPAGPGPWPVCRWIGRGPLPRHRQGPQARGFCGAGVARASGSRRAPGVLWGVCAARRRSADEY